MKKMNNIINRSRQLVEKTIDHMIGANPPEQNGYILKGEHIPDIMYGYASNLKNETSDMTSNDVYDYIELLYYNNRDYSLNMLQDELKEPNVFRGAYVCEAVDYILKNQKIDYEGEYNLNEIKKIFEKEFEGNKITKENNLDL